MSDKNGLLGWLKNYTEETQTDIRYNMLCLGIVLAMALICMCLGAWGCAIALVGVAFFAAISLFCNILFGKKR